MVGNQELARIVGESSDEQKHAKMVTSLRRVIGDFVAVYTVIIVGVSTP
jgi:hypothetical protein